MIVRRLTRAVVLVAVVFSSHQLLWAQGPPINTDTPIMLGLQGRGFRTFSRVIRKATLRRNGSKIADPNDHRVTAWVTPLALPYNLFNDRFQLGVIVPLMRVEVKSIGGTLSSSGIGDMRLFAKYLLYQYDRRNQTIRVASKAGVKLPTGDENSTPALGSGSTDLFFTTVAAWIQGRVGVYAEGIYNLNTTSGQVDFGNSFGYNVAFGYRLLPAVYETYPSPQLNLFLELNGTTALRNQFAGRTVDDSGGTTIFLSPGVQYVGGRRWLIEASWQVPVVNELHGAQLATDWTLSLGTRILLF